MKIARRLDVISGRSRNLTPSYRNYRLFKSTDPGITSISRNSGTIDQNSVRNVSEAISPQAPRVWLRQSDPTPRTQPVKPRAWPRAPQTASHENVKSKCQKSAIIADFWDPNREQTYIQGRRPLPVSLASRVS